MRALLPPSRTLLVATVAALLVACGDAERAPRVGGGGVGGPGGAIAGSGAAPRPADAAPATSASGGSVHSLNTLFDDPSRAPRYRRPVTIQPIFDGRLGNPDLSITGFFTLAPPVAPPPWLRATISGDKGAAVVSISNVWSNESGGMLVPIYAPDAVTTFAFDARVVAPPNGAAIVLRFVESTGSPRTGVVVDAIPGTTGPFAHSLSGDVVRDRPSGEDGFIVFLGSVPNPLVRFSTRAATRTLAVRTETPAISLVQVVVE